MKRNREQEEGEKSDFIEATWHNKEKTQIDALSDTSSARI